MALRTLRSTKQYGHRVRRNQRVTEGFPVLTYGGTPNVDTKDRNFGGPGATWDDPGTTKLVLNP